MLIASSWTISFAFKIMYIMWSTFKWLTVFGLLFQSVFSLGDSVSVCSGPEIAFNAIPYMPLFFVQFWSCGLKSSDLKYPLPQIQLSLQARHIWPLLWRLSRFPCCSAFHKAWLHLLEHLFFSIPQWTLWFFILARNSTSYLEVGTFFYLSLWPLLYITHFA